VTLPLPSPWLYPTSPPRRLGDPQPVPRLLRLLCRDEVCSRSKTRVRLEIQRGLGRAGARLARRARRPGSLGGRAPGGPLVRPHSGVWRAAPGRGVCAGPLRDARGRGPLAVTVLGAPLVRRAEGEDRRARPRDRGGGRRAERKDREGTARTCGHPQAAPARTADAVEEVLRPSRPRRLAEGPA
jgi:hypothetical protein